MMMMMMICILNLLLHMKNKQIRRSIRYKQSQRTDVEITSSKTWSAHWNCRIEAAMFPSLRLEHTATS